MTSSLDQVDYGYHEELRNTRQQKGNPVQQTKELVSHSRSDESNAAGKQKLPKANVHDKANVHPPWTRGAENENEFVRHSQEQRPRRGGLDSGMVHDNANRKGSEKTTRQNERELTRHVILFVDRVVIGVG